MNPVAPPAPGGTAQSWRSTTPPSGAAPSADPRPAVIYKPETAFPSPPVCSLSPGGCYVWLRLFHTVCCLGFTATLACSPRPYPSHVSKTWARPCLPFLLQAAFRGPIKLRLPLEMSPRREAACRAVFGNLGFFSERCTEKLPLRVDFIHQALCMQFCCCF